MKIALITNAFLPVQCGMEIVYHNLATFMKKQSHDIVLFAPKYKDLYAEIQTNYDLIRYESFNDLFNKFKKAHNIINFEIILAQSAFTLATQALKIKQQFNIPIALRLHGEDIRIDQSTGYGWRIDPKKNEIITSNIKSVDSCIAISRTVKNEIYNIDKNILTFTINNGVNVNQFRPQKNVSLKKKFNIPTDYKIILMVGRNVKIKSFHLGLIAFSEAIKKFPEMAMIHVGKDGNGDNLQKFAKDLNISNNFYSYGPADHSEIAEIYNSSDIFIFPSKAETFGNVTIEAMACGVPCIEFDYGSNHDKIINGVNGYIIPYGDTDQMSNYLLDLVNNKDKYKEFSHSARKHIVSNFSWNRIANTYVQALSETISQFKLSNVNNKNTIDKSIKITLAAYGPNQINGPNIWLQRILPKLAQRGFAPHVIFLMHSNETCQVSKNLQSSGIKCTEVIKEKYTEHAIKQILEIIRTDQPDIFIPNLSVPAYFASKWALQAGIPCIGVIRSDDNFHHELIETFAHKDSELQLSAFSCKSQYLGGLVRNSCANEREVLICASGTPVPESVATPPVDSLKIIYTGRLIQEQKRIFDVIASCKMVTRLVPGVEIAFYGQERERGKVVSTLNKLSDHGNITYGGILQFDQILPVLLQHHVFILLSDYEGMSTSLMEAMACGLVPICTRTKSGSTEIIRHNENGLLVDNREEDFLNAVRRLKTEKGLWERLSKGARETIEKDYSTDICAYKWSNFLRTLIDKSGERKPIRVPELHEIILPPVKQTDNGMCREDKRTPRVQPIESLQTNQHDNYLNLKLTPNFADLYIVRAAIKSALDKHVSLFHGTILDVGCGQMPYREYILATQPLIKKYVGLDFAQGKCADLRQPDLTWDGTTIPLTDESVDCAMATEMLEHCPEPLPVLKEIRRVLVPGGSLFFTTQFLWTIHDAPHDHYRYTPYAMQRLLAEAGFEDVRIEALGGWNASLAQMIGLWLKRAPMPEHVRQKASADLFPFYQQLINTDAIPSDFSNNTMAIGFSGIASKRSPLYDQQSNQSDKLQYRNCIAATNQIKSDTKLTIIQSGFPSLSATFIIDQMTGLIDRGVTIENWATYDPKLSSIHPSILNYGLLSKTKYLKIGPRDSTNDSEWVEEFLKTNQIALNELGTIHVHYGSNFVDLEPFFKILKNHIVVSFHGHDASRYFKLHGDNCYKYLFERANIITTPSYVMRDELIKRGCDPNKILVHRYGINLDDFNSDSRTFNSKKITFLTVGRLVEKKGIEFSIKAFSKICNELDCEYHIIGNGHLFKKLKNLVHYLKISDKVKFLGEQNKDVVVREMKLADIFVLTSVTASDGDQEGVPVSLTEAQAMGLPVISSFHSGIPELVLHQKTGLLSGEKDIPDIAKNMLILAQNNDLRREYSVHSRKRVLSEFNIEILNDNLLNYIQCNNQQKNFKLAQNYTQTQTILKKNLNRIQWCEKNNLYAQHIDSHSEFRRNCSPTLSVIIISWRLHPHTVKNLHILKEQQNLNFEIIFVDNGAKPGEFNCLFPYIDTYVRLNSNSGAYLARNIGSVFSRAPILFFLDDDAIPADNIIESHLNCFKKYDVIAVRGVCRPKTNNSLNQLAKHYYLGPKPFPIYADIEGNTSYLASTFFKAGGWDDEIRFGGGGVDLSRRLVEIEPDMRKQIYSPDPIIFHDYAVDNEHLTKKRQKQIESHQRLKAKHHDYDIFLSSWNKLKGRDDILVKNVANEIYDQIQATDLKTHTSSLNFFNNNKILISICIPTYNREKFISEAIQSSLAQKYPYLEIVIVDDGSTDRTENIVKSFDSKLIKYVKKEHTNAPDTRNRCIAEAKGDYILWLDSDDILSPDIIENYIQTLNTYPDLDILICYLNIISENGTIIQTAKPKDWHNNNNGLLLYFLEGNPLRNPGALVKKSLYDQLGFYNTTFTRCHDYEFWSRVAINGTYKCKTVKKLLCFYRIHQNTLTGKFHQIKTDFRFEQQVISNILNSTELKRLFHNFEWSNDFEKSYKEATIKIVKRFIEINGLQLALKQCKVGLKILPKDEYLNKIYYELSEIKKDLVLQYISISKLSKTNSKDTIYYTNFLLSNLADKKPTKRDLSDQEAIEILRSQTTKYTNKNELLISLHLHLVLREILPNNIEILLNIRNINELLSTNKPSSNRIFHSFLSKY